MYEFMPKLLYVQLFDICSWNLLWSLDFTIMKRRKFLLSFWILLLLYHFTHKYLIWSCVILFVSFHLFQLWILKGRCWECWSQWGSWSCFWVSSTCSSVLSISWVQLSSSWEVLTGLSEATSYCCWVINVHVRPQYSVLLLFIMCLVTIPIISVCSEKMI